MYSAKSFPRGSDLDEEPRLISSWSKGTHLQLVFDQIRADRASSVLCLAHRLVREASQLVNHIREADIVLLFLERDEIAHRIRMLQAQVSNLGLRLKVGCLIFSIV